MGTIIILAVAGVMLAAFGPLWLRDILKAAGKKLDADMDSILGPVQSSPVVNLADVREAHRQASMARHPAGKGRK